MKNDSFLTFIVGLTVGTAGIFLGASYILGGSTIEAAVIAALVGAAIWGIATFFIGWIPVLGSLITFAVWLTSINLLFSEGWISAGKIALIAWIFSILAMKLVSFIGLRDVDVVGVPGL